VRVEAIAADLRLGGIAVQVVADIARWKAGKLLGNLINGLDALYPASDLRAAALTALQDEARAVFAVAGIEAADLRAESTVDLSGFRVETIAGRDRGGNSTWQSLARAAAPETDYLNGEVVLQARLNGLAAPLNAAIRDRVRRAVAEGTPAGSLDDADLAATLPSLTTAQPAAAAQPTATAKSVAAAEPAAAGREAAAAEPTGIEPAAGTPASAGTWPAVSPRGGTGAVGFTASADVVPAAGVGGEPDALDVSRVGLAPSPADLPFTSGLEGEPAGIGAVGSPRAGLDCCSPSLRSADMTCSTGAPAAAVGSTDDFEDVTVSETSPATESADPRARVLAGVHELYRLVAGPDAPVLLDVRWALGDPHGAEHYRAGHLPGAVYVDLDTELAGPHAPGAGRHPLPEIEALQESARRWGVTRKRSVVVYDNSGGLAAARAWWLLKWAGVPDVRILDGGLGAWAAAGYGQATGEARPRPAGDIALSPGHLPTLTADEAAALAQDGGVLLDARAGERYRGEVEPVDPRAGHIPGAVSAPTGDNLADGAFRGTADLRERFAGLIDLTRTGGEVRVGVYCGSGVTAAHEIAALAVAGVDAALYPGSWSAWSSDPARPLETGVPDRAIEPTAEADRALEPTAEADRVQKAAGPLDRAQEPA
jgi:3-mercaptopyruvate sulfurtransferase SseA